MNDMFIILGVSMEEENQNSIVKDSGIKPANKKMTIFNFLFILVVFIGLFIYMLSVDGLDNILYLLTHVKYNWVIGGMGCLLVVWLCETITLHLPLKKIYPDQTITYSLKVTLIGQLFNNITPFSSGGQPMQAYELKKKGRRVSDSLSVLAMKFIITQTALLLFTIIVMIMEFNFFKDLMQNFLGIAIVSFAINILAIIFVFLAAINEKIVIRMVKPLIHLGHKLHIIKNVDILLEKTERSIRNFHCQFQAMKTQKSIVFKMFIVSLLQCLAYYSITYMVYRAFGNSGISFWQIIPAQAFLLLIMTFIPTPGSGIGAEGGFLLLFNSIFKEGTIHMSILFWRLYTFYLPIIVGALFLIPNKRSRK